MKRRLLSFAIAGVLVLAALPVMAADKSMRLRDLTDRQLLDCIAGKKCHLADEQNDPFDIAWVLARRGHTEFLIDSYRKSDQDTRWYLMFALTRRPDKKALAFLRQDVFNDLKPHAMDSGPEYWALDYLARRCDPHALDRLARPENYESGYPVGCMFWCDTLSYFAKCNYRFAARDLVFSLNAACLNIVDEAEKGLEHFYPGACRIDSMKDIEDGSAQKCYLRAIDLAGKKDIEKSHP